MSSQTAPVNLRTDAFSMIGFVLSSCMQSPASNWPYTRTPPSANVEECEQRQAVSEREKAHVRVTIRIGRNFLRYVSGYGYIYTMRLSYTVTNAFEKFTACRISLPSAIPTHRTRSKCCTVKAQHSRIASNSNMCYMFARAQRNNARG